MIDHSLSRPRWGIWVLLLWLAFFASLCFGAVSLSPKELLFAVLQGPRSTSSYIFWYSRLPRTMGCLLAGGALALSGGILQQILMNQLASPSIIGINAGAGLGVTLCCALGIMSGWSLSFSAFLGASIAAFGVLFLSERVGASHTTVILSGVAINTIANALREGLTTLFPDAALLGSDFRVGGFSAVSLQRLIPAGIFILLATVVSLCLSNELEVLSLGDDTAHSLGLPVVATRQLFVILAAVLAGSAVSVAGLLSFVGLVVPHIIRRLFPRDTRFYLPQCAMGGGILVMVCDLVSRVLFAPYELPVGVLISLIGGPFFLILLLNRKGGRRHD